jgi:hypothetical protein
MKNLTFVVALTVPLLVASAASAVDEHHPDQTPAAAVVPAAPKDAEKAVQQMGENINKLRAQMDKIQKAKDPAERQKLVQEHMQTLRASMTTAAAVMGGMPGPGGMMGAGMMDCPMMGSMGNMMGEQMTQRMQQMEKRMDMMQMMLEQMRKP